MVKVSNKTIVTLLMVALVITVVSTIVSVNQLEGFGEYSSLTGATVSVPELKEVDPASLNESELDECKVYTCCGDECK